MPIRPPLIAAAWLLAAGVVAGAGWASVAALSRQVSPADSASLSQGEVARRMQSAAAASATGPTAHPAGQAHGTATASPDGSGSGSAAVDPLTGTEPTEATTAPSGPDLVDGSGVSPSGAGPSATAPAGPGPSSRPGAAPDGPAAEHSKPFKALGGTAVVTCTGNQLKVSVTPRLGWAVAEQDQGRDWLHLVFTRGAAESVIDAKCLAGRPDAQISELGQSGEGES